MAETQSHIAYKYTPSSAQSTRQLLDSTSSPTAQAATTTTTSTSTSNHPESHFRPPPPTQRSSSNYAEADAQARARARATIPDPQLTSGSPEDPVAAAAAEESTTGVGWRPRFGRKQSWSQQDMKRELQMSAVMDGAGAGAGRSDRPGFTETSRE